MIATTRLLELSNLQSEAMSMQQSTRQVYHDFYNYIASLTLKVEGLIAIAGSRKEQAVGMKVNDAGVVNQIISSATDKFSDAFRVAVMIGSHNNENHYAVRFVKTHRSLFRINKNSNVKQLCFSMLNK